ncbi:Sister chromatid cohesion protein PDS5 A, partial [Sarracenia purpurea var. burkii]
MVLLRRQILLMKLLKLNDLSPDIGSWRSDTIEPILCGFMFPDEFSVKEMVGNWIRIFSGFDKIEVKALEKILGLKQ